MGVPDFRRPCPWIYTTLLRLYGCVKPTYLFDSQTHLPTAPEYALDELLVTGSDMYSLGCVIYAVHCKGKTPFKTHGNLGGLRENAGKAVPGMETLDHELQGKFHLSRLLLST